MGKNKQDKLSVFMSLILRHNPDAAGVVLDEHGWANVADLIDGVNATGRSINMEVLEDIVRIDSKGRYSFNEDKTLIRANQGHSIPVDVDLQQAEPPAVLYHGTAIRFVEAIKIEGLKSMSRLYVHLSNDYETAVKVGKRHGDPIVFEVDAERMSMDGVGFYLSQNGVWLTTSVDPKYLTVISEV